MNESISDVTASVEDVDRPHKYYFGYYTSEDMGELHFPEYTEDLESLGLPEILSKYSDITFFIPVSSVGEYDTSSAQIGDGYSYLPLKLCQTKTSNDSSSVTMIICLQDSRLYRYQTGSFYLSHQGLSGIDFYKAKYLVSSDDDILANLSTAFSGMDNYRSEYFIFQGTSVNGSQLGNAAWICRITKFGSTYGLAIFESYDTGIPLRLSRSYLSGTWSSFRNDSKYSLAPAIQTVSSSSDLNSYIYPGVYASKTSAITSTLSNKPPRYYSGGMRLIVSAIAGDPSGGRLQSSTTLVQIAIFDTAPADIAVRVRTGTSWGNWKYMVGDVLSSFMYGDTLPAAGTPGRIFFKKVT